MTMSATMTKPTTTAAKATTINDNPAVTVLTDRRAELLRQRAKFQAEIPDASASPTSAAAEAMAAGEHEAGRKLSEATAAKELIARQGIADTDKAISILDAEIVTVKERLRLDMCRSELPGQNKAWRRVIAALRELHDARLAALAIPNACRASTGIEDISPLNQFDLPPHLLRGLDYSVREWAPTIAERIGE
jgi:hypothetical protein